MGRKPELKGNRVAPGEEAVLDDPSPAGSEGVAEAIHPYADGMDYLADRLKRLDLLVHREVLRFRRRAQGADPLDRYAAVTEAEADLLIRNRPDEGDSAEAGALLNALILLEKAMEGRVAISLRNKIFLPALELSRIFGLSRLENDILVVCLASEIDRRHERLFAYLQDDMTQKRPSIGLALSLCCDTQNEQIGARLAFLPTAPLFRYHLIERVEEGSTVTPFLSTPIKIDDRIALFLFGKNIPDPRIQRMLRSVVFPVAQDPLPPVPQDPEKGMILLIEESFRRGQGKKPVFYLHGQSRPHREGLAQAVCRYFHLPLLVIDAEEMAASKNGFEEGFFFAIRETLLQPAAIYIDDLDRVLESNATAQTSLRIKALAKLIHEMGGLTFLAGAQPWVWDLPQPHLFSLIELRPPGYADRMKRWTALLADEKAFDDTAPSTLATKHRLSFEEMADALGRSKSIATLRGGGPMTLADLDAACREQHRPNFGGLASRIEPKQGWDALVLPPDPMKQLREICSYVKYRHRVYDEWGFDRRLSLGKGLNILFVGPSGTGKTLAAEVIAHELGVALYRIDLSMIVSKYIGETEKNLSHIFREAQQTQLILFFDEADALFGKRSEVKDAHDRYANIEVAYLLQKIEEYEGMTILTTNLRNNIDDAFSRRMHFAVDFPFPEEADRRRIWEGVFPKEAPLAADLDIPFLARQCKLTGGHIKNVALHAAFLAAAEGKAIGMAPTIQAIKRELQKMGKPINKADFDPYHDFI